MLGKDKDQRGFGPRQASHTILSAFGEKCESQKELFQKTVKFRSQVVLIQGL